jgi:hypothetical protein
MLITSHRTLAAKELLTQYLGSRRPTNPPSTPLSRHFYTLLVTETYTAGVTKKGDDDPTISEYLVTKTGNLGHTATTNTSRRLIHNMNTIPALPHHLRYHQIALTYNTLPTDRRARHWNNRSGTVPPCHLCRKAEDSTPHLYGGTCETALLALTTIRRDHGVLPALPRLSLGMSLLDTNILPPSDLTAIVLFNWAVWKTVTLAKVGEANPAATISSLFTGLWACYALVSWKKTSHLLNINPSKRKPAAPLDPSLNDSPGPFVDARPIRKSKRRKARRTM